MSMRTVLIGVLAIAVGLAAVFGVLKLRQGMGTTKSSEETVKVVVPAVDIPRGTLAAAEMFTTREYPKSVAPKGVVTDLNEVANRVPKDNLIKDEPVLEARLSPKGTQPGFSNVLSGGMRAITIKTPSAATVGGGFIMPGNKVDVLFTRRSQGGNDTTGGGTITLLLQMVEVLAINQKSDPSATNKMEEKDFQTATLLVTTDQMMKLELAQNLGTLTLALRNGNDKVSADVAPLMGHDIRMSVGRPFSETVKDVSDSVSKAWEQMQAEIRKTAKATADAEKLAMEKAMKEEAERMKMMKEENDRLKAELEQERVRLEKLTQAQVKPVVEEPVVPLKVRTIRNNVPGSVDVPSKGGQ